MPIRIVIGPPGKRRSAKLTDLVPKMTGRRPVFTDDRHVKDREKYQPKRRREI